MLGLLGSMLAGRGGRMIGGMIGGRTGAMIGGMAGAMLGGRQLSRLGGVLRSRGGGGGGRDLPDAPAAELQERDAEVLIRAMCNAAKADGVMDEAETDAIMAQLDDISEVERRFLRNEIAASPITAAAMAAEVPPALKAEAYAVSLISINVDTAEEADYLRELAAELGLSDNDRDNIHDDLGADLL